MSPDAVPADAAETLAGWLRASTAAVAFSGAGISTESGIPDFRSPGGVWSRYQPVYYEEFMASPASRHEYWRQKCEAHADFAAAKPNAGHLALARWERQGRLAAVLTQNIDGLHRAAGGQRVLELHGTALEIECQDCHARFPAEEFVRQFQRTDRVPDCPACKRDRMKHATISFGQPLVPSLLHEAFALCRRADLVLALGSSLVVEPAASLPRTAKQHGARLAIVNRTPTPLDSLADLVLAASIGETLDAVANLLEKG